MNKAAEKTEFEPASIPESDRRNEVEEPVIDEENLSPQERIARKFAKEHHGYDPQPEEEPEEKQDEEEPEDVEQADPNAGELALDDQKDENTANLPEMVEVKINGQVRQVEKSKVEARGGLVAYQKEIAANEKLQKAAEDKRLLEERATELERREKAIQEREQALKSQPSVPDAGQSSDPPQGDQLPKAVIDKAKAYRETSYADDETADKALTEVILAAQPPAKQVPVNEDQIAAKAAEITVSTLNAQNYETNRQAGIIQYKTDYPEIAGDSNLDNMADAETDNVLREHPEWANDPTRVILEAAKRTSDWVKSLKGEEEGEKPTDFEEKKAEKRALRQPKSGSGKTVANKGPQVQTRADYVTSLRKQRGLE